jgi:threonine/homoserine/homoserine lactone efflux protein
MPEMSTLLAFMGATIALLFIPGPAVIYILNRSIADGRKAGLAAVAGLEVGDSIQALFAALGISAVLATSAEMFNIVKWAGVVYLVYTGIRTLTSQPSLVTAENSHVSLRQAFRQGIFVNALNPKTGLFFLSIFPQFVDANAVNAKSQSLVLGFVFVILASIFNASLSFTASSLRDLLLRGKSLYIIRRYVSGGLFIGLGILAVLTGRPATSR